MVFRATQLRNACNGKTKSQNGLNVKDMEKYLSEQGIHVTGRPTRNTMQSALCKRLGAVEVPSTKPEAIQGSDDSRPIETKTLYDVYDEARNLGEAEKQGNIQKGFLVEKRIWMTTPAYAEHMKQRAARLLTVSLDHADQWKTNDQDYLHLPEGPIPGWIISLLVHGTTNMNENGDILLWLPDSKFDSKWMHKLGTVELVYNGWDGMDNQLTLRGQGLEYYNLLNTTRNDSTLRKQIPV
jgi:hypothetical protein